MTERPPIHIGRDRVLLDEILRYITLNCYDTGHGLLGPPCFAIDVEPFMDQLVELTEMSKDEMAEHYDSIRREMHGSECDDKR